MPRSRRITRRLFRWRHRAAARHHVPHFTSAAICMCCCPGCLSRDGDLCVCGHCAGRPACLAHQRTAAEEKLAGIFADLKAALDKEAGDG